MSDDDWSLPDQLVAVAAQTPIAMYMRDREGRYRWFNDATVRFIGLPAEEIEGRRDDELFQSDSSRRTREEDEEVMRSGRPMVTGCRVHTADDRDLVFVVEKYPCRGRDGAVIGVFVVARDVTDLRSRRRLTGVVSMDEALYGADLSSEAFLGTISHELRSPIHVIVGICGVLQRGLAGPLGEGPTGYVTRIQEVAGLLSRLVDDLLDMTQHRAGKLIVKPEPCAVAPLAREVLEQLAPMAERLTVRLVDDLRDELPMALADGDRLRQVLANLVANALKFTPAGGQVTLTARRTRRGVRVEVVDTGVGIAPGDMKRLFEPFSQLDAPPRVPGGTGMGLAISRTIIAQHHGELGVFSDVERGSTFWFEVPLAAG